ncbi:MAG: NUDIX domain-containing protein [Nanoarchaeota archaeon]
MSTDPLEKLKGLDEALPHFPDGRIDYTHANVAAVIIVFVQFQDQILLLKRSEKVGSYRGKWSAVAGYLDSLGALKDKVHEELREELNLKEELIASMTFGTPYRFLDKTLGCTWLIHPVIVDLKERPVITLDWEHTEYAWITPEDIEQYDAVPNLKRSWQQCPKHL